MRELDDLLQLDDGPGPAEPQDAAAADRMVAAVMAATAPPIAARASRRRWVPLAVAATLVTGVAAAGVASFVARDRAAAELAAATGAVATEAAATETSATEPASGSADRVATDPAQPDATVAVEGARPAGARSARDGATAKAEPVGASAPAEAAASRASRVARRSRRPPKRRRRSTPKAADPGAPSVAGAADDSSAPIPSPAARESVEDRLAAANRLRRDKRWSAAAEAYADISRAHPRTDGAYVATVAEAAIRLGHLAAPRVARSLYRRAIQRRPQGSLDAEACFGVAKASRALGDSDAEVSALRRLIAKHPGSIYVATAAARLEALEAE